MSPYKSKRKVYTPEIQQYRGNSLISKGKNRRISGKNWTKARAKLAGQTLNSADSCLASGACGAMMQVPVDWDSLPRTALLVLVSMTFLWAGSICCLKPFLANTPWPWHCQYLGNRIAARLHPDSFIHFLFRNSDPDTHSSICQAFLGNVGGGSTTL